GTAEAASLDDRTRDSARFVSEMPVISLRLKLFGEQKDHHEQADGEGHEDHPEQEGREAIRPGGFGARSRVGGGWQRDRLFGLRSIIRPPLRADYLLTSACHDCASWI